MSRAAAGEGEEEQVEAAVEQEVAAFEEIDKLTEFAIGASDVKKYGAFLWRSAGNPCIPLLLSEHGAFC